LLACRSSLTAQGLRFGDRKRWLPSDRRFIWIMGGIIDNLTFERKSEV
jgi:hypothetical protein